jgi:hypothetical protein
MNANLAAQRPDAHDRTEHGLYLVCGLIMLMILLLDLSIPLGVAMGVPYVIPVCLSMRSQRKTFTILVAVFSSLFTIGAYLYKPPVDEMWKVVFNRALALLAIWVTASLGLQRKIVEQKRETALRERERALEDMRVLRGLLPICASCKRIRDDQGYWTQIEGYIKSHSEADFTHGICPECARKLYPELYPAKAGRSEDTA